MTELLNSISDKICTPKFNHEIWVLINMYYLATLLLHQWCYMFDSRFQMIKISFKWSSYQGALSKLCATTNFTYKILLIIIHLLSGDTLISSVKLHYLLVNETSKAYCYYLLMNTFMFNLQTWTGKTFFGLYRGNIVHCTYRWHQNDRL